MELIRHRRARSTAALISLLAIAVIAPAVASGIAPLPKPGDPTIVPGLSLGGVSVGQPMTEAEAAWGNTLNCKTQMQVRGCNFFSRKRGFGSLVSIDGAVNIASINAPAKHGEFIFKGPLMDFGTERGDLGLGDKLKQIAKRYPDGKLEGWRLTFNEDGNRMTFFSGDKQTHRVTGIGLVKLEP
jgi:hypothetical protein